MCEGEAAVYYFPTREFRVEGIAGSTYEVGDGSETVKKELEESGFNISVSSSPHWKCPF